jgi:hypothetical protein
MKKQKTIFLLAVLGSIDLFFTNAVARVDNGEGARQKIDILASFINPRISSLRMSLRTFS